MMPSFGKLLLALAAVGSLAADEDGILQARDAQVLGFRV